MTTMGFIGVGTISEAMVRAMCTRPDPGPDIVLSPRSADRSVRLAEEFAQCRRLESNQAVIDASDIVVLAMRPQQLGEAVAPLGFRDDQIIASLIAGTPPTGIVPLVSPADRVCQLIPLPAIALHRGPLVISPAIPEVMEACAGLGEIVTLDDESRIRTLSCASAFMATYYEMQNALIAWIAAQGIDEATASRYVRAELDGLAAVGMATPDSQRADLPAEHQTKGGLNERVRAGLLDLGWFDTLVDTIDGVHRTAVLR
jgi:pyrroline-5-carboxylate reductase